MASETAVTSGTPAHEALAYLPLPRLLHLLTGEQLRGAECVWCCETLDAAAAFDFGTHTAVIDGVSSQWFPRACRTCVGKQARKAFFGHRRGCKDCPGDDGLCARQAPLWDLTTGVRW